MKYIMREAGSNIVFHVVADDFDVAVAMVMRAYPCRLISQDKTIPLANLFIPPDRQLTLMLEEPVVSPERDELLKEGAANVEKGDRRLPNGCTIFWRMTEQGREYVSDEIGGGVMLWHTGLVDQSTLIAAVAIEMELQRMERELLEEKQLKAMVAAECTLPAAGQYTDTHGVV